MISEANCTILGLYLPFVFWRLFTANDIYAKTKQTLNPVLPMKQTLNTEQSVSSWNFAWHLLEAHALPFKNLFAYLFCWSLTKRGPDKASGW